MRSSPRARHRHMMHHQCFTFKYSICGHLRRKVDFLYLSLVQGDVFLFLHLWTSPTCPPTNPPWCVQTPHFFNCYHHPWNNMLMVLFSCRGGLCPSAPRSPPRGFTQPSFSSSVPTEGAVCMKWNSTESASWMFHCWCLNCLTFHLSDHQCLWFMTQSFFAPFLGKAGWFHIHSSRPDFKTWVRTTNRGRQRAA